jgi:hypothetical protein
MKVLTFRILLSTAAMLTTSTVIAQDDPQKLGRPQAMVEIEPGNRSPREVLLEVTKAAKRAGFEPREPIQWSDGFFRAVHVESHRIEHWVVCWLDWKFNDPGRTLGVYVDYEKYKNYSGSGWRREPVGDQERSKTILPLSRELRHLAGLP